VHTTPGGRRARDDRHFDRWAARYDRSLTQSLLFGPVQRSVVAAVAPRLPPGARVLDRLRTALPGAALFGLDRSSGMTEAARHLRSYLRIERGTAESLPHPDGCFDAVVTTVSFHHWTDKVAAVAEVRRVLRPGGLLVLSVPYDNPLRRSVVNPLLSFVTWRRRRAGMRLGFVEYRFTAREVCRFLTDAGFAVVSVSPNDYAPPRTVGLWVDWQNLTFNPFARLAREDLFLLPRPWRRLALALMRLSPWTAAGEVAVVARAS